MKPLLFSIFLALSFIPLSRDEVKVVQLPSEYNKIFSVVWDDYDRVNGAAWWGINTMFLFNGDDTFCERIGTVAHELYHLNHYKAPESEAYAAQYAFSKKINCSRNKNYQLTKLL